MPNIPISAASLNPDDTYKLLTGIVVPRPIAWITTLSESGVVNLAPFSCFTFVSNSPPLLGINIGRKAGQRKDTANHIARRGEFVVHIGHVGHTQAIHESSAEHAPEVSEVELLGLATVPSTSIAVPRLVDAPISMECRLERVIGFGDIGAEFFVGEVKIFHVREGLLHNGRIDSRALDPVCRLGGPNYASLGTIVTLGGLAQTGKAA